jgi:gamma-glutamyltranspeptidase / glutathione hydrolase
MMPLRFLVTVLLLTSSTVLSAQHRSYGRSVVATPFGIVATSEVEASQAGARMLERGGSAIDAGIAANAVLGVMEPMMNGLGGDLFAIYYDAKTGKLTGINASGWAPNGLTIEHLQGKDLHAMPRVGIDSVTVPGAVDGWAKLHGRFGKLPWRELFQPAISVAGQGYAVPEIIDDYWKISHKGLMTNPESRRVFLPGDQAPERGQLFRNPDLARALTLIANEGETAFYKGAIARAILKTSSELSGTMTAADLAEYSAEWVEPISVNYRGWTIYELPPNGDGMAALEMLNIMEQSKVDPAGPYSPGELHTRIEAMKLAYADVKAYDGDPRFNKIPAEQLLSKSYAAQRAALIDPGRANCTIAPGALSRSDTTYFTVVDREGNILSMIQSNAGLFGSEVTVDGMGFRAARPRRRILARSKIAERARRPQAPVPHHHPGFHADGRPTHRLRHHGRNEPAARPCPVRVQCGRLRHEYPGRARRSSLHCHRNSGLQYRDRIARGHLNHRCAHEDGPSVRSTQGVHRKYGSRKRR